MNGKTNQPTIATSISSPSHPPVSKSDFLLKALDYTIIIMQIWVWLKQANVRRGGIRMLIRNIYRIVEEFVLRLCSIEPVYTIFMRD